MDESTALVTALNPIIGYARASQVAQEALASGRRVADLVLEKGWMTRAQLDDALRPEALTRPQYSAAQWPKAEG
jgi:aspartate ammonia-lyase